MNRFATLVAAAVLVTVAGIASPANAQLGGLLGDGGGGGGLGGTVDSVTSTVGGVLGGDGGGGTGGLDTDLSDGYGGVNGVATLSFNNDNGANADGTVLGGGNGITIPLNGLLGGDSSAGLDLPGLGLPGIDPSAPGAPGVPGVNGRNGNNGFGINGRNGSSSVAGSSRLRQLMAILADRAWLRFVQGNRLCLPSFAVMNVAVWVRQGDQGALQQLINAYASDIGIMQQMMMRCRNGQGRLVDLSRVIGVQLRDDGRIVVMTI